jgi:hypothetical protein
MTSILAHGYAVVRFGQIDVRTVSPEPRAAKVNWLVTHGTMVLASHTDQDIEAMWTEHLKSFANGEIAVRRVVIEVEQ